MHWAPFPHAILHPQGEAHSTVHELPAAHVTAQSPAGHVKEQLSFEAQVHASAAAHARST
jgi:hypothetical protein